MNTQKKLIEFLKKHNIKNVKTIIDGALINPNQFMLAGVNTKGAVLFADLPGFSKLCSEKEPIECAYYANHFFSWFEAEAIRNYGGIIDKYIGDEIMIIYPQSECEIDPLEAAMRSAEIMIRNDHYSFEPKIGIACGSFVIALVGTINNWSISCIGNTVNLASRCVLNNSEVNTVSIASQQTNLVKQIFKAENSWTISENPDFQPKNMEKTHLIQVHRTANWILFGDYFDDIQTQIENAYKEGFIKNDV